MGKTRNRDRVFLSYASEDLAKVELIYEGLVQRNLNVWFDKQDLKPGPWKPQIMKAISRSRYFVICISNAALKKTGDRKPGFQDEELQRAYEIAMAQPTNEFVIVPVRIEKCSRGDHRLKVNHQYDLFKDIDKDLDHLAVDLGGMSSTMNQECVIFDDIDEGIDKGLDYLAVDLGGISKADSQAKDTRSEDEKLIDNLLGKAEIEYYAQEYLKALKIWELVLKSAPNNFTAWFNKGSTLMGLGHFDEALAAYDKATDINPNLVEAWTNKGVILGILERYDESLAAVNKALELEKKIKATR